MDLGFFMQNEPNSGSRKLKWGMANGRWQMANDEWQMADSR